MKFVKFTLSKNQFYLEQNIDKASDELLILSSFLNSDLGASPEIVKECLIKMPEDEYEYGNLTESHKIGTCIELDHQFIENLNKLVIPLDKLLELIDTWVALVKVKTKVIIIREQDGEYSIETGKEN